MNPISLVKKIFRKITNCKNTEKKKVLLKTVDRGINNTVTIADDTQHKLLIVFNGSNNSVVIGKGCSFFEECSVFMSGDNNTVVIGDNVTFDGYDGLVLAEGTTICIGDDCMFARKVAIRTSDQHAIYDEENTRINQAKDVTIESHVWLGNQAVVMKGTTIGSGSIVGMRSMVTKDIPKNSMAVGQPAKVIKENIHWTRTL